MQKKDNNSKKKEVYKVNNKKNTRIYITIVFLILLLLQFIALGLSSAKKLIEIDMNVNDGENLITTQNVVVNAIDSGDSGFFILLPNKVNNIYITEYHVKNTSLIENDLEELEEDEKEEKLKENLDYDVKVPGEKVFLSEEELSNKEIEITAIYNSKEADNNSLGKKLYYQDFYEKDYVEGEEYLSNIVLEGFLPLNLELYIESKVHSDVDNLVNNNLEENYQAEKIVKLGFKENDEEYDISVIDEDFKILIFPVDSDKVYNLYTINRKPEYIGKENIKDALGNPINLFNIKEAENYSVNEKSLNVNISIRDIEYIGITSRPNALKQMMSPMGTDGLMPLGMEIPEGFDLTTGTDLWDGSVSTSFLGSGQANDPYLITSGADLAYLRNRVNSNVNYEGQYFQLTNNIDLNNNEWEPIGSYTRPFRGNLDGGGRTIKNALIIASGTMPGASNGNVESYGLFASIGGATSTANRQVIQNLQLDNIVVESRYSGTTATTTTDYMFGINLGTLTGTMYQNSTISNVNIKNMDIHHTGNTMSIRSYRFQYLIGGLVGEAIRLPNTIGDPGANLRYSIVNCVVDGNISMNTATARNMVRGGQFATGGIIGRIRSQPVWPENCVYRGDIYSSTSFIGPIFAQLRDGTNVNATGNFNALWQGNDAGNLTCTSSYNSYRAYNTSFTNTVISGNSTARRSSSTNNIGYVQGVNKGIYQSNNTTLLNALNASTASDNVKWTYSASAGFELRPRLRAGVNENPEYTYTIQTTDTYSSTPYTYQWIANGVTTSNTSIVYVHTEPSFDEDIEIVARVKDNAGYISIYRFIIPRLSVELSFNINHSQNTAEGILSGTGWYLTKYADYSFQWYREDISGFEETEIEGANTRFITDLDPKYDYKLVATNNVISQLSAENSFAYAERTVIYIDEENGNNYNDGFTPTTAVKNFSTAYGKLPASGNRETNVIVVMDHIRNNDIFSGETSTTYQKNVTITGVYKKVNYNGVVHLHGESTYKYMNGDTTFMYVGISGIELTSSWFGGTTETPRQLYWYLQGYSLTMGEQVVMDGYPTANTNQGLITGNAPAFHVFGSWHKYNQGSLPRNNPEVIIKSGTFGRIVLGGSPGTNDVSNLQNNTSRNFIGSANDMYNTTVTIDIKNSTTPSTYAYDVNLLVGGSAAGNNYSNVVQNIISGKVGRVLGGAIGDSSVRPSGWSYPINTFMGSVKINISGGEVTELYGGSLGRNMSALTGGSSVMCDSYFYGLVEINISGGLITGDIYGAGAGRSVWIPCRFIRSI